MMTCDRVRDRLDVWIDGRVDSSEHALIDAHVEGCADCRLDVEAARAVRPAARGLPRAIPPERDLWAGIEGRLRPVGRGRVALPAWLLAAAAVLLIASSSAVTVALLRSGRTSAGSLPAGFAVAEAQAVQTADHLSAEYQRARNALAPSTREVIERNLAVIDRALAEARAALAGDPGNPNLLPLVLAAWQRKIEFLERVSGIERET
jgi:hypothetical protein